MPGKTSEWSVVVTVLRRGVVQVNDRYVRADFLDPYLKMLVLLLARFRQHPT